MKRKHFLTTLAAGGAGLAAMGSIRALNEAFKEEDTKMPVLFIGHGSPMNGIEDNDFSNRWKKIGQEVIPPKAVLVVSAHWLTKGTHITAMDAPKTIHDFGGFPQELFDVQYPAPGSAEVAKQTSALITDPHIELDHEWGLDHGAWTVLRHMYPNADIPVLQLSIDYNKPAQYHYDLAKQLAALRKKGVLIVGSGNMVHNLRMVAWDKLNEPSYGFDWTHEMNSIFKQKISDKDHAALINYEKLNAAAKLAIPTPDHYYPLIYTLALQDDKDEVSFFNDQAVGGSLTMTSVRIG